MRLKTTIAITLLGLVVAACGAELGASETSTTVVETTTTTLAAATTTSTAAASTTTTAAATTTTAAATTTTSGSPATTILRGDSVDLGPPAGAVLGVIGVRYDDVLNLRARPGADQPIVARIPPTYENLMARGETRHLPGSFWTKVRYEASEGWVNMAYIGYIGVTDDVTSQVISEMGGRPEAATMTALGRMVAEALASEDPPSRVVNVVEESVGDLGEVTFDVVGLGDDSVRGVRLHVFGEPSDGGFTLRTVEQTILCDPARGVDDDGICA